VVGEQGHPGFGAFSKNKMGLDQEMQLLLERSLDEQTRRRSRWRGGRCWAKLVAPVGQRCEFGQGLALKVGKLL
jgi:hypothetical protein